MRKTTLSNVLILFLTVASISAKAQWTTQTIQLRPGWNAVFLEVQPERSDCDTIFAGLPVESVWAWNKGFSTVQFIQDPNQLVAGDPDWLTWVRRAHPLRSGPNRVVPNLFSLLGHHSYLIKCTAAASWTVRGRPGIRRIEWLSDSFNLIGLSVNPTNPPTFRAFFEASPAHHWTSIFHLTNGSWIPVSASDRVNSGEAYWVYCKGPSIYPGPLSVKTEQSQGLDYGRTLTEQTVRIRNTSTNPMTVELRKRASDMPPAGFKPLAGDVALYFWRLATNNNRVSFWQPLSQPMTNDHLLPGEQWLVRLAVQRSEMSALGSSASNALFQSLIEVTDNLSTRVIIPVTAEGLSRAGLWIGSAAITRVNEVHSSNPATNLPVASPFPFRLIVHIDQVGQTRLLQRVWTVWKEGIRLDGELVQPGRFVLLTGEASLASYTGTTLRDGQPVARRVSSSAFGHRVPAAMTGGFGQILQCDLGLDYDDALNPFKHRYHPCHDNTNDTFTAKLPEGRESFTVNRHIELEFSPDDPDNLQLPGWGDNQVGGTYREVITGLHRSPLRVQGTFRLQRASSIPVLNDEN